MADIEEILADVKQEGTPIADMETATPSESPTEKEPEKVEPGTGDNTADENVPFHKHPRWIERETKLKELEDNYGKTLQELEELKSFKEDTSKRLAPEGSNIPDWFTELYGANDVAWRKYEEHDRAAREEIKREVIETQEKARQAATQETERWNKWVDKEIETLQSEGNVFDRNKLIATMLKFKPTDDKNNFDFRKCLEIYNAIEGKDDTSRSHARKQLADTTTTTARGDKKIKNYMTPADLRNTSWNDL